MGTRETNEGGHLTIGGCDVTQLAKTYGTPLFIYDDQLMRSTIRDFHKAFQDAGLEYEITYASKAFCTVAMCQLVYEEGCGVDVVSGGELHTALTAGVPANRIYMHGNNKTRSELEYAVSAGIGLVIVDNFYELELLNGIAANADKTVEVLLRMAPGVEAHTHEYISTGQQDSKFGFDYESGQAHEAIEAVTRYPNLRCVGLHSHIGSQIFETTGFVAATERMAGLYADGLRHGLPLRILNLGGGFGIRYTAEDDPAPPSSYASMLATTIHRLFTDKGMEAPQVWIEPGRSIAGPAGITVYTVGSQKRIEGVRNYVAIDGGMTDNPRLALYGAKYEACLANRMEDAIAGAWSVAGKCCETGDMVIWDAPLPEPNPGDLLVVFATGAYNYSMASHYNRIPNPAVVFVNDGKSAVVVERETWDDLVRLDKPIQYQAFDAEHGDGSASSSSSAATGEPRAPGESKVPGESRAPRAMATQESR